MKKFFRSILTLLERLLGRKKPEPEKKSSGTNPPDTQYPLW